MKYLLIMPWKQNNLPKDSYAEFFRPEENEMMSKGMLFCLQGMISKYFMAVSIHFNREYNKLDGDYKGEVIDPKELENYRVKILLDKYAIDFARNVFVNEIM